MKFKVIDKETGDVLDIDKTSQMSIDTAGRLCGNDSLSGLYALDPSKYEVRFPEHEALKAELEKWKKFYAALPDEFILPYGNQEGPIKKQTRIIAHECGIELP
jgi:hypothetical protein